MGKLPVYNVDLFVFQVFPHKAGSLHVWISQNVFEVLAVDELFHNEWAQAKSVLVTKAPGLHFGHRDGGSVAEQLQGRHFAGDLFVEVCLAAPADKWEANHLGVSIVEHHLHRHVEAACDLVALHSTAELLRMEFRYPGRGNGFLGLNYVNAIKTVLELEILSGFPSF